MRLSKVHIKNFRSIRDSGEIRIEPLQALVGENNCGKSNVLRAVQCFLSSGAGGMEPTDFNDPEQVSTIECEFSGLTEAERIKLRPYLINDRILLRKELIIVKDEARNRVSVKADYHGYRAEPAQEQYSIAKLEANAGGGRVNWKAIAEKYGITNLVEGEDGKITKASYTSGIARYLAENVVEYDAPRTVALQRLSIVG